MTVVDPVYLLQTVFKVYEREFPPIGNKWDEDATNDEPKIRPNFALRRERKGRPISTRIFCDKDLVGHRESTGQPKLCTICKNPEHIRRTCPYQAGPSI